MLVLRKAHYALQNAVYKSPRSSRTVSIPLRQLLLPPAPPALPAEIWFLVLELLEYSGSCLLCKHSLLCTLARVSRVFNEFATRALYQTLDLRFSGDCNVAHHCLKEFYWYPKPHITNALLKSKLDQLDRTLRVPRGPVLLIRHLKLPEVNIAKHPSSAQNILDVLPAWVVIFELCSGRLESVAGLGNLWSYLHHFNRTELRTRLCDAIERNPHWAEWDWLWDSWGYAWWSALTEEPRILEMYRGWTGIRHVSIDTAEWATSVLGFLPELQSLAVECGDHMNDLRGIFQQVPLRGLTSLAIRAWVPPQDVPVKFDHTEPLNPLIDYLERCGPALSSPSHSPPSSVLTSLDIRCCWPRSRVFGNTGSFYPKSVFLDDFLFSVFTLAPLLRTLKLDLRTLHEEAIPSFPSKFPSSPSALRTFTARHLHTMAISLPSRTSKTWLAAHIASNSFPRLSHFEFRSAMTRRAAVCRSSVFFCECTLGIGAGAFLALNDFGRAQDTALVTACQQAGVREWEMQILHVDSVCYAVSFLSSSSSSSC